MQKKAKNVAFSRHKMTKSQENVFWIFIHFYLTPLLFMYLNLNLHFTPKRPTETMYVNHDSPNYCIGPYQSFFYIRLFTPFDWWILGYFRSWQNNNKLYECLWYSSNRILLLGTFFHKKKYTFKVKTFAPNGILKKSKKCIPIQVAKLEDTIGSRWAF